MRVSSEASFDCVVGEIGPVETRQDAAFQPIDISLRTLLEGQAEK